MRQYGRVENVVRLVSMIVAIFLIFLNVQFHGFNFGFFIIGFNLTWMCQTIWRFVKKLLVRKHMDE